MWLVWEQNPLITTPCGLVGFVGLQGLGEGRGELEEWHRLQVWAIVEVYKGIPWFVRVNKSRLSW